MLNYKYPFEKYILLILIPVLCASCGRITTDPNGESDFVIENKTDGTIYLTYTINPEYSELKDSSLSINGNEKIVFLTKVYGGIGIHALPSEVFEKIEIFSDEFHKNEIYNQYPVYDTLWQHETPNGYAYWRYAIYTLIQP